MCCKSHVIISRFNAPKTRVIKSLKINHIQAPHQQKQNLLFSQNILDTIQPFYSHISLSHPHLLFVWSACTLDTVLMTEFLRRGPTKKEAGQLLLEKCLSEKERGKGGACVCDNVVELDSKRISPSP